MLWRREVSLPPAEIQTLGHPAGSLVPELAVPSRLQMFASNFLVNYENLFSFRATEIAEVKRMCAATATFEQLCFDESCKASRFSAFFA